jgi:WhiB family redox-sensing transcriptional regulator
VNTPTPRLARPGRGGDLAPFDGNPAALCRVVGAKHPDLFFIPDGLRGKARRRRVAAAQSVCHRCPLRADCAAWALANIEDTGLPCAVDYCRGMW